MNKSEYPKITFGIIVLNGEPFTRYCLRSIYPFAYEIIVVEGGHEDTKSVCTPDGHSVDGTLEALNSFKKDEDPENKVTIITRDGFWPKKDELGNDRTPQSRAYAERAKGDYLWQVDIDEFYRESDVMKIFELLKKNPLISAVSFKQKSFWGDINYISDAVYLRKNVGGWHRIFKWGSNYKYVTHEPPTITDENGVNVRTKKWIPGEAMARRDIYMFHYSLLFPWQVEQKVKVYKDEKPGIFPEAVAWAENNYFKLGNPYRVHNVYGLPSWLIRYQGKHPEQIVRMMNDIKSGKVKAKLRQTDDVEAIIDTGSYKFNILAIKAAVPLKLIAFHLMRVKNIPNRIRKIINKSKAK
jgi:hypothetical protein